MGKQGSTHARAPKSKKRITTEEFQRYWDEQARLDAEKAPETAEQEPVIDARDRERPLHRDGTLDVSERRRGLARRLRLVAEACETAARIQENPDANDVQVQELFRSLRSVIEDLLRSDPVRFLRAEILKATAELTLRRTPGRRYPVVLRADVGRAADHVIEEFSELWPEHEPKLRRVKRMIEQTVLAIPRGRPPDSRSADSKREPQWRNARPSFDDTLAELLAEFGIANATGGAIRTKLSRRSRR